MATDVPYDREALIDVLLHYKPKNDSLCLRMCGWNLQRKSFPEHVADVYEVHAQKRRERAANG